MATFTIQEAQSQLADLIHRLKVSGSKVSLRPRRACHAGEPVSQASAQGPRIFLLSEVGE